MYYAIKFNTGEYWCGYNHVDTQIRKAVLYKSKKKAIETADDCMSRQKCFTGSAVKNIDSYTIVGVNIEEVILDD